MNVVLNNFILLLFSIFVYYASKGVKKKCTDTHYVPLYNYKIDYKPPKIKPLETPDTVTQHVTTKIGKMRPIFDIDYRDSMMNYLN